MPAPPKHREAILRAAMNRFRRHGYSGTGLKDIVKDSGAPRGSVYHYFPGGKPEIAEAAIRTAGGNVTATLKMLAGQRATPGDVVLGFAELIAGWMAESGFRDGSPMTTVLLEAAPDDELVTAAGREAFDDWRRVIAAGLKTGGATAERAETLALLSIAAIEGSLVQARVEGDAAPILMVGAELKDLIDRELPVR